MTMIKYSNTRIQCYKSCRRMYELKYVIGVAPLERAESLKTGASYHEKIEQINKTGDFVRDDNSKTNAMAYAYKKFILPKLGNIVDAERWWESEDSNYTVCGIIDAIRDDGVPIEFKTTSGTIDGSYWLGLENDEQILMYLSATGKKEIVYAVIQVPTIRQRQNESADEFEQRCIDWYDESKAQVNTLYRSQERIDRFKANLGKTISEIETCDCFYPNPNNCMRWGRLCEYAPICNNYNVDEYVDYEVRKNGEAIVYAH